MIVDTTLRGRPNSYLCTKKVYSDFELEFEVRIDPQLSSSIQIHSNSFKEYKNGRVHGYQVEISADSGSDFIYDEGRRGWLSANHSDQRTQRTFKNGQ